MSDTTELTVLKMLAAGRRVRWVATATSQYPKAVLAIADKHGVLLPNGEVDYTAAGHAAAELLAATGSIPARDPAPVKQRPAPPVRVNATATDRLLEVPIGAVHPDPDNPRGELTGLPELAASLKAVGLLQPIVVRRDGTRMVVVMGHRRLAAARLAGWTKVKVIVRATPMRPDDVLAAMLVENSHRADLDPIEEARALRRLQVMHGDCSHTRLAAKVGRHQTHVSARLALLALSAEDQDAVRAGAMKLVEATAKARLDAGRVRPARPNAAYFSAAHDLAPHAKARCRRLHTRVVTMPGGVACGDCWSSVIRASEREHLHAHSARTGACALCSAPLDLPAPTPLREATA